MNQSNTSLVHYRILSTCRKDVVPDYKYTAAAVSDRSSKCNQSHFDRKLLPLISEAQWREMVLLQRQTPRGRSCSDPTIGPASCPRSSPPSAITSSDAAASARSPQTPSFLTVTPGTSASAATLMPASSAKSSSRKPRIT